MPSNIPTGPLLIFIAALLWALDGVLRRMLYDLPPSLIVLLEHVIGLIIIAPFLLRAMKTEKLSGKEWGTASFVALLSGVLGTLFFTAALLATNFIPFSVVYLVQKLQPIFAVVTARLVLGEKVGKQYVLWAALALIAGYFVTFPNGVINFSAGGAYVGAALYAFLAAVAWGSSTAFSRSLLLKHSGTFVTGMRFLLTVPIALAVAWGLGALPSVAAVTWTHILVLGAIALTTGMAALWIYYRGLRTTRVAVSAIVELTFPLTAVFVDYALYHTVLAPSQYLAGVVLLFAMYKIALLNKDTPVAAAPLSA